MRRALLLGLLLLVATARSADADRTAAEFFTQRGDKAAKDGDWAGAQAHYRRALEEDAAFLPARAGLADALVGSGDSVAGLDEMRKFVADAEAVSKLPPAWAPMLLRAKKRLAELDAGGAKLQQIVDKYAADMTALAARWAPKDAEVAALAWRDVLKVRPGDPKATAALAKTGRTDVVKRTSLFNGKNSSGWAWMDGHWVVGDGVLTVDLASDAMIAKTEAEFRGDFDVRVEARFLEVRGDPTFFALIPAFQSDDKHTRFGVMSGQVRWEECAAGGEFTAPLTTPIEKLAKPFDPKAWTWYEVRFRGEKAYAVVNGDVVGTLPRRAGLAKGSIALLVQNLKVAVRTVDIVAR